MKKSPGPMTGQIISAEVKKPKGYDNFAIEDAARHLMKAQEVMMNPELHSHAMKHLDKQKKQISSIQQLRDKAKSLDKADMNEEGPGDATSGAEEMNEAPAKKAKAPKY